MRHFVIVVAALIAAATASAQTSGVEPARNETPGQERSEEQIRYDCQAEADRRLRQEPAIASGQTLYMPSVRAQFLRECLSRNGVTE